MVESLPANAGDTGSSPGLGRSQMPRSNWAREPQLLSLRVWSLCSATREAATVRGPRTAMKSGPHSPQLEKALAQKDFSRPSPPSPLDKSLDKSQRRPPSPRQPCFPPFAKRSTFQGVVVCCRFLWRFMNHIKACQHLGSPPPFVESGGLEDRKSTRLNSSH